MFTSTRRYLRPAFAPLVLALALLAPGTRHASAQSLKVPTDIEYGDLSELGLPARIFVHAAPDAYSRVAIVKELERHPELVQVVGRAEDAQAYLLYFGPGVEEGASVLRAEGGGEINLSGTLVVFRMVEGCDGERPRQLFIERKTKTVNARFPLPLTALNGFAAQGSAGPRPSGKALGVELVVRFGLFLMHKRYPGAVSFDQSSSTLALSFSQKAEKQTAKSLIDALKKERKTRPYVGAGPVRLNPDASAGLSFSSIYRAVPDTPLPCPKKATQAAGVEARGERARKVPQPEAQLVTLDAKPSVIVEATPLIRIKADARAGRKRGARIDSQRGARLNSRRRGRAHRRP